MADYRTISENTDNQPQKPAEEKRVGKIVHGSVKTKKNEMRKFTDIFISEDIKNVKSYVFMDVLVPAIKKAISDIVTDGIDMILYGGGGRRGKNSGGSKVSYRNYYDQRDNRRPVERSTSTRFDYEDLVFETRGEAMAVREQMDELIERYGFVTVADLYDMAELSAPYTANKYGWININSADVVRAMGGGYIIKLPKAAPIDA